MTTQFDKYTFKMLLATTIREKDDSYIVSEIFTRFPSIQELLDVTEEELLMIKGIGKVKAQQIIAALRLARLNPSTAEERFVIRSPQDAYDYLKDIQYLKREEFVCLGLNTKNEIMFRETIFTGSLNASIVHPRETFLLLIKRCCASAIVAHNHPSGQPAPSREDIEVTSRGREKCGYKSAGPRYHWGREIHQLKRKRIPIRSAGGLPELYGNVHF